MKRILLASVALLLTATAVDSADAGDRTWLFERSYYSHDPVHHVRVGRQRAPGPVYTRPQGEYINAGFRFRNSRIVIGGQSIDHVNIYESWIQHGSQR